MLIRYHKGTLEVHNVVRELVSLPDPWVWDGRTQCFRAPAIAYAAVVRYLHQHKVSYVDEARKYEELILQPRVWQEPRPYQQEALRAWQQNQGRGVVVLPTGAGKTHVALMAMLQRPRSTLVVAPTLDLVRQWYDLLKNTFAAAVGVVGGGEYDVQPITVITYDSAYLHMDRLGSRFGLVIFDECHHLPSESYALTAQWCLAPYRLGLTATPERADGQHTRLQELIGPIVYRKEINELSGLFLADYETIRLVVFLSEKERRAYEEARTVYKNYLQAQGIHIQSPTDWTQFVMRASRSKAGQEAMAAYQQQRQLALAAPAKVETVLQLLYRHQKDRTLVFTQDNATAYEVSRRLLLPVITHQTKVRERSHILQGFRNGTYRAVVTSKVLNEGVDVPEANVAIVMSGSGSVREHVQRLGRILRKREGKRAILYELVTDNTAETYVSQRRREHTAYQR